MKVIQTMELMNMPVEILMMIFDYLEGNDVTILCYTCTYFYRLLSHRLCNPVKYIKQLIGRIGIGIVSEIRNQYSSIINEKFHSPDTLICNMVTNDLSRLEKINHIKQLFIEAGQLKIDMSKFTKLECLSIHSSFNQSIKLSTLNNLTNLNALVIYNSNTKMWNDELQLPRLEMLIINENNVYNNVWRLSKLTNLQTLVLGSYMSNNDYKQLVNFNALKTLCIVHNDYIFNSTLTDISSLTSLKNLFISCYLNLTYTDWSVLRVMKNLKKIKIQTGLEFHFRELSSNISQIRNLKYFKLRGYGYGSIYRKSQYLHLPLSIYDSPSSKYSILLSNSSLKKISLSLTTTWLDIDFIPENLVTLKVNQIIPESYDDYNVHPYTRINVPAPNYSLRDMYINSRMIDGPYMRMNVLVPNYSVRKMHINSGTIDVPFWQFKALRKLHLRIYEIKSFFLSDDLMIQELHFTWISDGSFNYILEQISKLRLLQLLYIKDTNRTNSLIHLGYLGSLNHLKTNLADDLPKWFFDRKIKLTRI